MKIKIIFTVLLLVTMFSLSSASNYLSDIQYIDANYTSLLEDSSAVVVNKLSYPGGSIPSAVMYFYSNGLLVIDSCIFSNNSHENEKRYYKWTSSGYSHLTKESKIDVRFIDKRLNFSELAPKFNDFDVIKIDMINNSVTLKVDHDGSISFFNFIFFK